ncbi:hypothetical protein [Microbulbifer pacificus]|uniref:hypothetical protein n=1 Tax=Microbulbifer pacificus TaxID=407164 RepID=UPI000CF517EA|nr:hypothetical protein [Microbulbifer pacificus]
MESRKYKSTYSGWVDHPNFAQWAWITGTGFSSLIGISIFFTSQLDWDLSIEGVTYFFFTGLRLPFAFLAGMLAVLGLWVSNFRSVQQNKQIEVAESQNAFSNYFKHREHLKSELETITKKSNKPDGAILESYDMNALHSLIFPMAKHGDLLCENFYKNVVTLNKEINAEISKVNDYQENFSLSKSAIDEIAKSTASINKTTGKLIEGFCNEYGVIVDCRISIMKAASNNTETYLKSAMSNWKEANKIFSIIIGCSFSPNSYTQIERITEQCSVFPWDKTRYIEITDPEHKTFNEAFP